MQLESMKQQIHYINIFAEIFSNEKELEEFLKEYNK